MHIHVLHAQRRAQMSQHAHVLGFKLVNSMSKYAASKSLRQVRSFLQKNFMSLEMVGELRSAGRT